MIPVFNGIRKQCPGFPEKSDCPEGIFQKGETAALEKTTHACYI